MAKITVKDQAVVIESSLTNEQLVRAEKYFPEVLVLTKKDEEDKTVPYFAIATTSGETGAVSKSGIEFVKGCKDEQAQVTVQIKKMCKKDKTGYIKDTYGPILRNLQLVEQNYDKASKEFDKEYAELDKNIVIE